MNLKREHVRSGTRPAHLALLATPLLAIALTGCEYSPDRTELETKVAQAEQEPFSACIHESYRAGVELEEARENLRLLQEGSPSDTVLREGLAAVDRAAARRARAREACLKEQQMDAARMQALEAQLQAVTQRLAELEAAQSAMNQEILVGVTFATGSATLTREAKAVLDVQADRLVRRGDAVEVAGYASTPGTEQQNLDLSKRRAETVREYLISRGVNASLVTARGYGTANPVASNETEGGRRANQRIELHFAK